MADVLSYPPPERTPPTVSAFSIDAIESLDYDFTAFPKNDGKGTCKGKGTIPEPSQARLEAYGEAIKKLYNVETKEDAEAAMDTEVQKQKSDQLLVLTAELCQDSPSKEELDELPPRICRAFMKWIYKELSDPEV